MGKTQDEWACTVCNHVYDPAKDGGGKAFEDLPDTWKCPVCGLGKSTYKKRVSAETAPSSLVKQSTHKSSGSTDVVPSSLVNAQDEWVCTVCNHVYDPAKDGGGKAFEDLPDTWKCPVCGLGKSTYKKSGSAETAPSLLVKQSTHKSSGSTDVVPSSIVKAQDEWVCTVCNHVYDPAKDGGGKAFENLPDTWKCPVCGLGKSTYKKSGSAQTAPSSLAKQSAHKSSGSTDVVPSSLAKAQDEWVCTVCNHVYDPARDGGGKAFEDLPDTWKCPVCGLGKSTYKKSGSAELASMPLAKPQDTIWACTVCNHVYDAARDGGGKAFEDLPDTWKCPVCGLGKSTYQKKFTGQVMV